MQGDRASHRLISKKDAWINAVDIYRLASMLDPSNFEARLNSAGVRLRLANDGSNAFQSVCRPMPSLILLTIHFAAGRELSTIAPLRSITVLRASRRTTDEATLLRISSSGRKRSSVSLVSVSSIPRVLILRISFAHRRL